ncbi:MAG TPA: phosphatase PAP2 family protein [Burkholderiales bacterium]|nr:phosphatase PAP2 family protein [Burkholderiales bacterium]
MNGSKPPLAVAPVLRLRDPAVWTIPLLTGLAFGAVLTSGQNQAIFLLLNAIGRDSADLWAHVTILGDTVVALALCLPLWRRRPDLVWALAIGAVLSTLWVHGLKPVINIDRPPSVLGAAVHVIGPAYTRHSFPSGHSTTAFAVAGLFALGVRTPLSVTIALSIAIAAAVSRAVVGVHWPLDLLAGAFGGWLSAVCAIWLSQRSLAFGLQSWIQAIMGVVLIGCAMALILGYKTPYEALAFQRTIGALCLAAAAHAWWRDNPISKTRA